MPPRGHPEGVSPRGHDVCSMGIYCTQLINENQSFHSTILTSSRLITFVSRFTTHIRQNGAGLVLPWLPCSFHHKFMIIRQCSCSLWASSARAFNQAPGACKRTRQGHLLGKGRFGIAKCCAQHGLAHAQRRRLHGPPLESASCVDGADAANA